MSIFDFLKPKKNTAAVAKDRLRIIIAQERSASGGPDYLPLLRRELLEVIRKYVNVDVDAVKVDRGQGRRARRARYLGRVAGRTRAGQRLIERVVFPHTRE
jgi:cell division topological specificity factor